MKRFFKALLALALAMICLASLPAAAMAAPAEGVGDELDAFIAEHADTTAGLAVAVFDADGVIYERYAGFADIENGRAVDADTVFEWGSVSKLLVWVSVMQLAEQGKISLDADVREYLPEGFMTNLRYDAPVTVLDLMNHDAGFQEMLFDIFMPEGSDIKPLEDAIRDRQPAQVYAPGTVTAYSNWGAALASLIVQRVSGMSYCDYVHQNIFEPLGMSRSAILPDLSDNEWVRAKRQELKCYTNTLDPLGTDIHQIWMYPIGMCTGTLGDLCAFGRALLDEDCPLFASSAARELLFSPSGRYENGSPRCCHGFWVLPRGTLCVGHGGNTDGCSADLELDLDRGLGMVVMTNQRYENVYCAQMPQTVFGPLDTGADALPFRSGPYRPARTIVSGPLKLYSLLSVTSFSETDAEDYALTTRSDGVVCGQTCDYSPLGAAQYAEYALFLTMLLGVVFSLVYLLVRPGAAIVRGIRKQGPLEPDRRRRRRTFAAVLQLLLAGGIAAVYLLQSAYYPCASYSWIFAAVCVLAPVMAALAAVLLLGAGGENKKSKRALDIVCAFFLLVSTANVIYWQMYRFWELM